MQPRAAPPAKPRRWLNERGDLGQRLLVDDRHLGILGRVADDEQQERPFVGRAAEHLVEETHGAWRMGQRG